jgi:hypothetical protein
MLEDETTLLLARNGAVVPALAFPGSKRARTAAQNGVAGRQQSDSVGESERQTIIVGAADA